jgi:hypothetical protein
MSGYGRSILGRPLVDVAFKITIPIPILFASTVALLPVAVVTRRALLSGIRPV